MSSIEQEQNMDPLRGRTVKWTLTNDPTSVASYEHTFHDDGSVEWRLLDGPAKGHSAREKRYSAMSVAENVIALSYLAASGHTLTVVLNSSDHRLTGYASGNGEWHPLSGVFEFVQ